MDRKRKIGQGTEISIEESAASSDFNIDDLDIPTF